MNKIEQLLQTRVRELFESGAIDLFIGFEEGTLPLTSRPVFIKRKADVGKLVWNSCGSSNLAAYLARYYRGNREQAPRIGIACRGCSARSVNQLVVENQVPADKVVRLSLPCNGRIDLQKVSRQTGGAAIRSACEEGAQLVITAVNGKEFRLGSEEVLAAACLECAHPRLGGLEYEIEGTGRRPATPRYERINAQAALPARERFAKFEAELARCIRCNACRQACPNCFCQECFADQSAPGWIGPSDTVSNVLLFHMGRIFHQAGRCSGCGACAAACPQQIDLGLFTGKLVKDAQELFQATAGLSADTPPALAVFSEQDNQEFITEP